MIYADPPRRYSARGLRWSHVTATTTGELLTFARRYGLRRRDASPFLHFDVTDVELAQLKELGASIVMTRRVPRPTET